MAKTKSDKLTERQERFCLKYFETGNGSQAVLDAGYEQTAQAAGTTSYRLLKDERVQARLAELRREQEKRTEVSVDYVVNNLREIIERCMQRAPVLVKRGKGFVQLKDEEGRDVWRFDANGANGALQMLGKHLKMFTEKREISGKFSLEDLVTGANEDE